MSSVGPARCSWHGSVAKHSMRMVQKSPNAEDSQEGKFPSSAVLSQLYASESASAILGNMNALVKRQQRFKNTPMQLRALRGLYKLCSKPSPSERRKLAASIGSSPDRVNVWFQNQRYRAKQKKKNQEECCHTREAIWSERMNTTATRIPWTTSSACPTAESDFINAELSISDAMILQDSALALPSDQSHYYATATVSSLGSSSFADRDATFCTTLGGSDSAEYQHGLPISRYDLSPPCSEGSSPYQEHIIQAPPSIPDVQPNWPNYPM